MLIRFLQSILVSALVIATSSDAVGGTNRWTTNGPDGTAILFMAADPINTDIAYAVTTWGQLYKTTNAGADWRKVGHGLPPENISALLLGSEERPTMFAAAGQRVFVSTDGGERWSVAGDTPIAPITTLAMDDSSTLYAAGFGGVVTSTDGGRTWTAPQLTNVPSLAVAASGAVLATVARELGGIFLSTSTDHGKTWTRAPSIPQIYGPVVADRESGRSYIVGASRVYTSSDDFRTSQEISTTAVSPYLSVSIFAVTPDHGHLYGLSSRNIFEYDFSSRRWSPIGPDATTGTFTSLATASADGRRFYVGTTVGVLTSSAPVTNWTPADRGLRGQAKSVAVAANGTVFASTKRAIFKSTTGGQSWQDSLPKYEALAVEASKSDNAVYASADHVYKSTDDGETWKIVLHPPATALAVSPTDSQRVYASLIDGLYTSPDGANTWSRLGKSLPTSYGYFYQYYDYPSIAVDPIQPETLYVSTWDGIYKTDDASNFRRVLPDRGGFTDGAATIAIDPGDHESIAASTSVPGVQMSADGGQSWTAAGLNDKNISALYFAGSHVLYAGSTDGHIYRRDPAAAEWSVVEGGLPGDAISRFAVPSSDQIYAATAAGVFEYHNGDNVAIEAAAADPAIIADLLRQSESKPGAGIVLPIAGSVVGLGGTRYSTRVTLSSGSSTEQHLIAAWLPQAYSGGAFALYQLTIPPHGSVAVDDIADRLHVTGLGALALFATDGNGSMLDANASIGATAQITAQFTTPRAPVAQSIDSVDATRFVPHGHAAINGLRQDIASRTNFGIVNLSSEFRQFTIAIRGDHASSDLTLAVPPLSLLQTSVPGADYGALSLSVSTDAPTRWILYATTLDNVKGNAQTVIAEGETP